ncbi:GDP-mannose 4,6-dehydratase [Luteimonas fraxinea]|nr:GDP-mannose 4,6-dehydratase [Luteimonas fraxinea]
MNSARPSEVKSMRVLVTGGEGFTGRYMRAELEAHGHEVVSISHRADGSADLAVDLCDREAVRSALSNIRVDAVIHLAAIAFVAHGDVEQMYRVNIVGTRNLLEALSSGSQPPRVVLLASSANIYGNSDSEVIDESVQAKPANDYAVSKLAMEYMAKTWMDRLPIVIARPFNYTGVGQSKQFVIPKIVDHYVRRQPVVELGNIDVIRDFQDVRDVVSTYRKLIELAPVGATFNLCSGIGHSLGDVLQMLAERVGYRIKVDVNPQFVRSNEVVRLVGDSSKVNALIGSASRRTLSETLGWMVKQAAPSGVASE